MIKLIMIKLIIFIILYHVIFHNNLEKMLCHTYFNYKNTKRPLDECNNIIESLRCIGMPFIKPYLTFIYINKN